MSSEILMCDVLHTWSNRLKKSIIHFILFCFALLVSLRVAHKQDGGITNALHGTSKLSISGTQIYFCAMFPTDTALVLVAFLLSRITKDSKNLGSVPEATCNINQVKKLVYNATNEKSLDQTHTSRYTEPIFILTLPLL